MKYVTLNESVSIDEIEDSDFRKKFPTINFYHGSTYSGEPTVMPFRLRSKPKDTLIKVHDTINEFSVAHFGLPIRNLLFLYTDDDEASNYGHVNVVIPVGTNYRIFYHPDIHDMTGALHVGYGDDFDERAVDSALDTIVESDAVMNAFESMDVNDAVTIVLQQMTIETSDAVVGFRKFIKQHLATVAQGMADDSSFSEERTQAMMDAITDEAIEELVSEFDSLLSIDFESVAEEYLNGIEEVTNGNQLDLSSDPEFMMYAPDGFYIMPQQL